MKRLFRPLFARWGSQPCQITTAWHALAPSKRSTRYQSSDGNTYIVISVHHRAFSLFRFMNCSYLYSHYMVPSIFIKHKAIDLSHSPPSMNSLRPLLVFLESLPASSPIPHTIFQITPMLPCSRYCRAAETRHPSSIPSTCSTYWTSWNSKMDCMHQVCANSSNWWNRDCQRLAVSMLEYFVQPFRSFTHQLHLLPLLLVGPFLVRWFFWARSLY